MEQQTAVDWLIEQYIKDGLFLQGVYEQAKAMEKEQIELAYKNGANDEFEHWMNNQKRITSLYYYKRAYEKNNEY